MKKLTLRRAIRELSSFLLFFLLVGFVVSCCMMLFLNVLSREMGLVYTSENIADAAKMGWQNLFFLMALISVNLGIFNLLPLPALDGGHIFYTLIELVTRRRLPEKVVGILDSVGLILLMGLMVVVALKDIFALF